MIGCDEKIHRIGMALLGPKGGRRHGGRRVSALRLEQHDSCLPDLRQLFEDGPVMSGAADHHQRPLRSRQRRDPIHCFLKQRTIAREWDELFRS